MDRYRETLIILAVALVIGVIMLVLVGLVENFKAAVAVGGTFWATGAFLGISALPTRRRRSSNA